MTICPACSRSTSIFIQMDSARLQRFKEYDTLIYDGLLCSYLDTIKPELSRCNHCQHVFFTEMPSDTQLSEMYNFKRTYTNDPGRPPSEVMVRTMEKYYKIIGKKDPVMLDYGAGHGRWSVAAAKAGFNVFAYEPHAERTSISEGYELITDATDIPDIRFDFIWCEQVLEHVKDPCGIMSDIKKYMSKKTLARVSVPNVLRAKEGSNIWKDWPYDGLGGNHTVAPYQHLQGYNQLSLYQLARRSGFQHMDSLSFNLRLPFYRLRFLLGKVFRSLSTTTLYLSVDDQANVSD